MGRKQEIPEKKKTPDHPQAELGLSHMWPEPGSNQHEMVVVTVQIWLVLNEETTDNVDHYIVLYTAYILQTGAETGTIIFKG